MKTPILNSVLLFRTLELNTNSNRSFFYNTTVLEGCQGGHILRYLKYLTGTPFDGENACEAASCKILLLNSNHQFPARQMGSSLHLQWQLLMDATFNPCTSFYSDLVLCSSCDEEPLFLIACFCILNIMVIALRLKPAIVPFESMRQLCPSKPKFAARSPPWWTRTALSPSNPQSLRSACHLVSSQCRYRRYPTEAQRFRP